MNRILEINLADRYARVEAGVTNLAISEAVAADGFFYAPDPSSQLACTIGGNVGMNSGGAHCLKYGVTVNNLLGVRLVTRRRRNPRPRRRPNSTPPASTGSAWSAARKDSSASSSKRRSS